MFSLSRRSSTLSAAILVYSLCSPVAAAQSYVLDTSYSGSTFFNGWNFWTDTDPTHGFVQYLSKSDAQTAGLISQGASAPAFMGVDAISTLKTTAQGRKSVRITTQKSWTHGLFIADIAHMPDSTCGVWPAFWMFGPNWPNSGEIDMIEGVSRNTNNQVSLHTGPNCQMTSGTQSGTTNSLQCDGTQNGNVGCNIQSSSSSSYGTGFNSANGGVYATEWNSSHITTWFFPRSTIPSDITSGNPVTNGWGAPQANYVGGSSCNIDAEFTNQSLVFDTTFCGDWAGNVWGNDAVCSGYASTCINYVAGNPKAFANSYWKVNSVKVYQIGSASSSSSTSTWKTSTTLVTSTRSSTTTSSTSPKLSSTSSSQSKTSLTLSSTSSKSTGTITSKLSTSTTTSKSSTSSQKPTTTTAAATWTLLGCYSDNVSGRALPNEVTVTGGSSAMTVPACQSACKAAGYVIAGLEYSQECWCGNIFQNGGAYVGADGTSGCTSKCKGNSTQWCGGGSRLSAYKFS